ncbi:E3 ubiquitin-protein ligase RNFT1 [Ricinus communis]|uniref:E3 ubiquitin-protein ligase RNFT1 n=1 Tax=Ricinus communis TaxID=3988 RepID=UPI00201A77FD|nr:E3 ubiquitin-protein ligase RNFT1 [Ricinus communis]
METSSSSSSSSFSSSSIGLGSSNYGGVSSVSGSNNSNSRRYGINIAASSLIHAPLTTLLEYSGFLGGGGGSASSSQEREQLISPPPSSRGSNRGGGGGGEHHQDQEVTIRIIGGAESSSASSLPLSDDQDQPPGGPLISQALPSSHGTTTEPSSSTSYQRYDIQNFARWIEHVLPFSLLLLLVFIRQHLQGFCMALWIAAVLFKSNDILRKQTALKGERKKFFLVAMTVLFMLHVVSFYWWYRNDDLLYPLALLPPTKLPPFWHAVFIIVVNDAMVRQLAMAFKCILLMYYKNSSGQNYRKQGQMLTLVEYLLLFYRALLPAPVWYRFFLNKEYGSLFSSLVTGLYLTFKLTSVLRKIQLFVTALRALSRKEMHYGSYATSEQVNAAGDLCAICQEKMHAPILLCCKHIFCEDCVSEWFERERTCPLCRALVKPADIRSYSDGSTSLYFQLF